MSDRARWVIVGLLVVVALVFAGYYWKSGKACRDRGGVPVRGIVWVECVEARP